MWSNIMELSYQFEGKLVQLVKTGFNKEVWVCKAKRVLMFRHNLPRWNSCLQEYKLGIKMYQSNARDQTGPDKSLQHKYQGM
jgi:hypothetical protein